MVIEKVENLSTKERTRTMNLAALSAAILMGSLPVRMSMTQSPRPGSPSSGSSNGTPCTSLATSLRTSPRVTGDPMIKRVSVCVPLLFFFLFTLGQYESYTYGEDGRLDSKTYLHLGET